MEFTVESHDALEIELDPAFVLLLKRYSDPVSRCAARIREVPNRTGASMTSERPKGTARAPPGTSRYQRSNDHGTRRNPMWFTEFTSAVNLPEFEIRAISNRSK
jgi:hypothetical protein